VIAADAKAQVYQTKQHGELVYRGCVYGRRRSFLLEGPVVCGGGSTATCGGARHVVLAGTVAAYETVSVENKYGQSPEDEWMVVVRDLRTGRTLHRVPTGLPLHPEPGYIGVGNVVALVLKSDGAAAWVADDYERTINVATEHEEPYFDVWVVDSTGSRQLAAGTDIDPSSLALSTGATDIGREHHTLEGTTLYWTQTGRPFSASLN
jgi:hypothetical protein